MFFRCGCLYHTASSFKLLVGPIVLYAILAAFDVQPNPFEPMLFTSYPISSSSPDDVRYAKGWLDIVFVLYHIIVFSFIRQFALLDIILPIARRLGIRKQAKLDRFGEQAYAMLYYGTMGIWGIVSLSLFMYSISLNLAYSSSWRLFQHGGTGLRLTS